MGHILKTTKGSSMLLAICIFLILTVLGINVIAASYSNVQNVKAKYENEQTMQYVNSIYEIIDRQIRLGKFKLDGYLVSSNTETFLMQTNEQTLQSSDKERSFKISIKFYSQDNRLKAEVYIKEKKTTYCIKSVYDYEVSGKYKLKLCEGVSTIEEE